MNFESCSPRRGTRVSTAGVARTTAVEAGSRPMSATTTRPAWNRPGPTASPTFAPWNVTVRSAWTAAPSTSPVEASTPEGRSTDRTGTPLASMRSISARGLGPGSPVEAGAEQRVDHDVRAREIVGLDRVASCVAQESRGDAPVPAVRVLAADDREAAGARERAERLTGDRRRRALHQLVRRVRVAGVPRLGRAHLVGGVERLVHPAATRRRAAAGAVRPGRRRTSRRPSCASGSARRRCRASRPARRTAASCP